MIAWQSWRIEVPDRWGPVRIEGNHDQGYMLIADLHQPRLGIRWKKISRRPGSVPDLVRKAIAGEIGAAGVDELAMPGNSRMWESPMLFEDRDPPGRDVWVAYGAESGRLFELVYHAHRRDQLLAQNLAPTLLEDYAPARRDWSIFDLSCSVPGEMGLIRHRLNLGDMALMFGGTVGGRKHALCVRQIGPAKLALSRRPLDRWIAEQASWRGTRYKLQGVSASAGIAEAIMRRTLVRRRRFAWMWWQAGEYTLLARHDIARDKLLIVDSTDADMAHDALERAGWAQTPVVE